MTDHAPIYSPAVGTGTIAFWVAGEPKGQPRPRACVRKFGNVVRASVYDAGTSEGWKGLIALAAKPFIPTRPLTGPLRVDLTFYFPRPQSHYRTGKFAGVLKDGAPHYCVSKPDIENAIKPPLDIFTQLGFWLDDSQVCCGLTIKAYPAAGHTPGCMVRIQPLEEQEDPRQEALPLNHEAT